MSRDIFNSIRLLRAPSNLALNVARDGAPTTSLGNLLLFQCLTIYSDGTILWLNWDMQLFMPKWSCNCMWPKAQGLDENIFLWWEGHKQNAFLLL